LDNQKVSILQMVNGAIQERVDYEVKKVIDNILDAMIVKNANHKTDT